MHKHIMFRSEQHNNTAAVMFFSFMSDDNDWRTVQNAAL
jgi:hypothetical protein